MKFLFDLFPIALFFAIYRWGEHNPDSAHGVVQHYLGGLISGGNVTASQSPIILATVVGILATVLQIGYLLARRKKVDGMLWVSAAVIVVMGGATIYLHDDTFIKWKPTILYWAFVAFLLALGALNLLVAFVIFKGDTSAWVNFKVFGATGIFFLFIVAMGVLLSKHMQEEEA